MKISSHLLAILILSLAGCLGGSLELEAQGPLTPPGPPAPSMRSLNQFAPRIPLESLPSGGGARYAITTPGSYFASATLTRGAASSVISVAANNVVIDFNGFGVTETSATAAVVIDLTTPRSNLQICNGSISGPSIVVVSGSGTEAISNLAMNDLRVSSTNGIGCIVGPMVLKGPTARRVQFTGLDQGLNFLVLDGNVLSGAGTISECTASNLTSSVRTVFAADLVEHCTVENANSTVGLGAGFAAISAGSVNHCVLKNISTDGGGAAIESLNVADCSVYGVGKTGSTSTVSYGIFGRTVRGCTVSDVGNSASGASTGILGLTIEACAVLNVTGSTSNFGINTLNGGSEGIVSKCTVKGVGSTGGSSNSTGISAAVVQDCNVYQVQGAAPAGVTGIAGGLVRGCRIDNSPSSAGSGIVTNGNVGAVLVENCAISSFNTGVMATHQGVVQNCSMNGVVVGVTITSAGVRIDNCQISVAGIGVGSTVDSSTILVCRNHIANCATPFVVGSNVRLGPVVSGAGGVISNSNPWANFTD